MISGGEGRGKDGTSHCRHQQAQMKVMSNHYFPWTLWDAHFPQPACDLKDMGPNLWYSHPWPSTFYIVEGVTH